jgi:ankyrin repeat protein
MLRRTVIAIAFLAGCATGATPLPLPRHAALLKACSGHGVLDGTECLCLPGYDGADCKSKGGAYAEALTALESPNRWKLWIQAARRDHCKYVNTLTVAAAHGYTELLDELLDEQPREKTELSAPLLWASAVGATTSLTHLLAHHADANASSAEGYSALMRAARLGWLDTMQVLVQAGAKINATSKLNETALTEACSRGRLEAVRWLVEHGADLSHTGKDGWGALALSFMSHNRALLEYVAAQLERVHAPAWHCYQTLDLAAGSAPRATLEQVYASCAEPYTLRVAGTTELVLASAAGMVDNIEWLIDRGVNPDLPLPDSKSHSAWSANFVGIGIHAPKSIEGATPLVAASIYGQKRAVEALLLHGATTTTPTSDGYTALIVAAMAARLDVLQMLIQAGANVDDQTFTDKLTPLMYAAWRGAKDVVLALLAAGATTSTVNASGQTALDLARSEDHAEVVEVLEHAAASR